MSQRQRNIRIPLLLIAVAALVLGAPRAPIGAAGPSPRALARLDSTLRSLASASTGRPKRVIIRARPGGLAALRQALAACGARVLLDHPSINGVTAIVRDGDLASLADAESTLSVAEDAVVRPSSLLGGVLTATSGVLNAVTNTVGNVILPGAGDVSGAAVPPWVLRQTLGVDASAWTGRGVGIAVIDSGLEMSAEFSGRVDAFYDMRGGQTIATAPFDDYGHGTHVAGAIAASGALSINRMYRGLAPNAHLLVLKVLDGTGAGYTSDVIRAIDFAVENRARFGVSVINLSLGHPITQSAAADPLVQAVERASRAGVIVCVAAGNLGINPETGRPGYAGITSPGNAPSAITVGAARTQDTVSRSDDRIPDYSSAGPTWYDAFAKPDVLAPGHNIVAVGATQSWIYKTYPQLRAENPSYIRLSGTSMATSVASGAVALLVEASRAANPGGPGLTPNAVKAILEYSALGIHDDNGLPYDRLRRGAGSLNGSGAIQFARSIDTSTPLGEMWLRSWPLPVTIVGGQPQLWSQETVWGDRVIWGSTIALNEAAWGNTVIWGSGDVSWGSRVIWGSNVVWSDSETWGSRVIWGSDSIGYTDGQRVIWGSTNQLTASSTAWKDVGGESMSGGQSAAQ